MILFKIVCKEDIIFNITELANILLLYLCIVQFYIDIPIDYIIYTIQELIYFLSSESPGLLQKPYLCILLCILGHY